MNREHAKWRTGVVVLCTALLVARVAAIPLCADPDNDAYGHFRIARAVLAAPTRVDLHWVWLPGYHFLLAGCIALGATFTAIRLGNAVLAALLPALLFGYAARPGDDTSRRVAWIAAFYFALVPLVNLLGLSAQQETLFTACILLTAWSIDSGHDVAAGCFLALGCLLRYEAWGAAGLLLGLRLVGLAPRITARLPAWLARASQVSFWSVALPSLAMGGWLAVHRIADRKWFGFLTVLYDYTRHQRVVLHKSEWMEVLWFPVIQPVLAFGLGLVALPLGLRRALRPGFVIPLGIYLFLMASYISKGSLGSGRYYESLAPFVCLAAAYGTLALAERRRGALPWVVFAVGGSLALITLCVLPWSH